MSVSFAHLDARRDNTRRVANEKGRGRKQTGKVRKFVVPRCMTIRNNEKARRGTIREGMEGDTGGREGIVKAGSMVGLGAQEVREARMGGGARERKRRHG